MLRVTGRAREPASARSPLGVLPCSSGGVLLGDMVVQCRLDDCTLLPPHLAVFYDRAVQWRV